MTPPVDLASLFTKAKAGDRSARDALITHFYNRIIRLTAAMLHTFPTVRRRREVESVTNDLVLKLDWLFDDATVKIGTEAQFFQLASTLLRRLLLDEVRKYRRRNELLKERAFEVGATAKTMDDAAASDSCSPESMEEWTLFHEQIAALPEEERTVVEMHLLMNLTQAEVARMLCISPKKISRTYQCAMLKLADYLPTVGKG